VATLALRKLTGTDRRAAIGWAGRSGRTVEELQDKIAELEAMGDLPW
jgi:hypothetical protein